LRKPTIHSTFGLPKEPGVTDYVLGNYDWREVVNTITDMMLGDFEIEDILRTPGLDNLHVITGVDATVRRVPKTHRQTHPF